MYCQSNCHLFFLHLFQVNDYVKNYIGDGKGPKNFAKDYVERRSKWRNALKSKKKFEDDLLTPAAAINPNNDDEVRNSINIARTIVHSICLIAGKLQAKNLGGRSKDGAEIWGAYTFSRYFNTLETMGGL